MEGQLGGIHQAERTEFAKLERRLFVEHEEHDVVVGAEAGAARHLVDTVGANGTRPHPAVLGLLGSIVGGVAVGWLVTRRNAARDEEGDALAAAQMEMAKVEREKAQLEHQRELFTLEQKNAELARKNDELEAKFMIEAKKLQQGDRKLDQEDRKIDNDEDETALDAAYKDETLDLQEKQMMINARGQQGDYNA